MKISDHADHTEKLFGIRGTDIHKWLDGFFEHDGLDHYVRTGRVLNSNPYDHRKFRHCQEALEEAYQEFTGTYSKQDIKRVFETHVEDDYNGYIPSRNDFMNGMFTEKYHDSVHQDDWNTILDSQELSEYFKGVKEYDEYKRPDHFISSFGFRIVIPTVVSIILFVTSIFFVVVPEIENSMMNQKKRMIKELTASAISIADQYITESEKGIVSVKEAQRRAIKEIGSMRYGDQNKDYFFITDMTPTMIMHPYRGELIGTDLSNYTDTENKSGKKLFVEFVDLVKSNDEGYLEYQWQWKDDSATSVPKLSYVRGLPKWNWLVGTGVYVNDVTEEIARLKRNLYITFLMIAFGLILVMSYITYQSHKTEARKKKAEILLHEAKDRYRALVETSNEGYILIAEGDIIYSNMRLKRMVGYRDKELHDHSIWSTIFPQNTINAPVLQHFIGLFHGEIEPGEFEAQLRTKTGQEIDIILSTSKIFLSEKKGYVVSFRPITRKVYGSAFHFEKEITNYRGITSEIVDLIEESKASGGVVEALDRMPNLIRTMIDAGSRPDNLRRVIGAAYDAAIYKFITFSIAEIGEPPVKFSFISMGSNARHDMTLFSDQDNAIVFEDCEGEELKTVRRYFLHLAERVCKRLDQAGYLYCEGFIMATNPQWCLSVSEWKENFSDWIINSSPDKILEANVFFDVRSTYGMAELVDELQQHVFETTRKHEQFFINYAKHCLSYTQPINIVGKIKTEIKDGVRSVNLKECLRPMEIFCRIYALKYDIREANTVARLKKLAQWGDISRREYREMIYIFDHIWNLRFVNQMIEYTELRKVNDSLVLDELTQVEQETLRSVLARVSIFQDKVSKDFLAATKDSRE